MKNWKIDSNFDLHTFVNSKYVVVDWGISRGIQPIGDRL